MRSALRTGALIAGVALSCAGVNHGANAAPPGAASSVDRILLLGRDGWVHEPLAEEGLLRVALSDPEGARGRSVGLLVLACDARTYRLHFSLDRRMRQRARGNLSDGFAHFVADPVDAEAASQVSFYVDFRHSTSFRSRSSLIIGSTGSVPELIELFLSAARIVTLVLAPRATGREFTPHQRFRLILEPGDGALLMDEALAAFQADCRRRR